MGRQRSQSVVCQQLVAMVTDYLEGDLDPTARSAVEQHLTLCEHCTGYVEQVQRMLELTANPDPAPQSPPVTDAMLDLLTEKFRLRR